MALKHIYQLSDQNPVSAKVISEKYTQSYEVTARVLQSLSSHGVLKVEHGVNGGYKPQKSLDDITLFQLMEIVDGPQALAKCIEGKSLCDLSPSCNITSPIEKLNLKIHEFYQNISLSELLDLKTENMNQEKASLHV